MRAAKIVPMSENQLEESYSLGFSLYQSGSWDLAEKVFRELCAKKPLDDRFWFGLAACLQETQDYSKALESWAMTALLSPENPYPHFHAADCYLSMQNLIEARKALNEASLRIQPGHFLEEKIEVLKKQWESVA